MQPVLRLIAALALVTPHLFSQAASAQDPGALLHEAERALAAGRPLDALAAWRRAWLVKPSYEIACTIGRGEHRFGRATEAAEFLSRCLKLASPPSTPDAIRRQAEERSELAEARGRVVALTIHATEPGARIAVDGTFVGTSPLSGDTFVDPGSHRISAELEGFAPAVEVVRADKGEARDVKLELSKPPRPPLAPRPVPAPSPTRSAEPNLWVALGGAGVSGLGVGLGTGLALASKSAGARMEDHRHAILVNTKGDCPSGFLNASCLQYRDAEREQQELRVGAAISFIGAGLAAIGTVSYVLVPRSPVSLAVGAGTFMAVGTW